MRFANTLSLDKDLVKGHTTADDLRRLLGRPAGVDGTPGDETWTYTHRKRRPQTPTKSVRNDEYQRLTIRLANGKVVDFSLLVSSESPMG